MKTPEQQREYQRSWIAARRAAFFSDKKCVRCGATEKLELDHIDPKQKTHHAIWSWSEPRRVAEIAKCQVLCAACHMKKSIGQQPITHGWKAYRHGTRAMYEAHKCRCGLCTLWNRNRLRRQRERQRDNATVAHVG